MPVKDPVELDFKSREQVLAIRSAEMARQPGILDPSVYRPSEYVYGRIRDGRPWWGIDGLYYYGTGELSIRGPSEESRFLVNPYLLVGVTETSAFIVRRGFRDPKPYPLVTQLVWHPARRWGQVVYDVQRHLNYLKSIGQAKDQPEFLLITLNAQDMGFWWFFLDPQKSLNVQLPGDGPRVQPLKQFIHLGGSCRYPKGCNNASPATPELEIRVTKFPATVEVRLWSRRPVDPGEPADMTFEVVIANGGLESLKDSWSPH